MTASTSARPGVARAPSPRGRPRRRRRLAVGARRPGSVVVLVIATLLVLGPFLWMVSLAFTPEADAFGSASLVPADPTLDNFLRAWSGGALGRAFLNSLLVTTVAVITNCVFATAAGYAFSMLPFRGSSVLFYTLIATVAVPVSVTLIPLFLMAKTFPLAGGNDLAGVGGTGLLDTLGGVVLPYIILPMNIFLAKQFFDAFDKDMAEAARIDGASELRIFVQVYLPLARPLVAVVAIFSFTGVWDDFLWPLVVTSSQDMQTVQLALTRFLGSGNVQYGALMAASVLVTLPVLAVFLFNQRHFISGLADGSVKG
ncbi:carbohydrate ABC transporter permease [Pengzhenrongella sicca]|uniref:Carbohydrate ABC transporter permease n=1 Tax=Pengzhenrongella sicca TaxID=2819238 RepID=A0A8A4ZF64_9MICO|nr:carbohydrate ABC transporter permease [Pengzhenrongella sicca]QTE29186.1 carbohydrate ABC transporter permease [Pengzhenrongella sicca]